jgi:hypothetical protein
MNNFKSENNNKWEGNHSNFGDRLSSDSENEQ